MATTSKPKDTTNLVKDKKVKAPSNSQSPVNSNQGRTSSGSPSIKRPTDQRPSSSPSEKRVLPNYLRPTLSSRNESFKYGKKPSQEDGVSKPVLNRRRSFDKPISLSRMEKSFDSPGPKERTTNVRPSSSSLAKSTVSASGKRGLLDSRASKSFKHGMKSPAVNAKSNLKKDVAASSCSRDDIGSETMEESKVECLVQQVEGSESEFPVAPEMPTTEVVESEVVVVKNEDADNGDCRKIKTSDIMAVSGKGNEEDDSPTDEKEGSEEKLNKEEAKIVDKEEEHEEQEKEMAKVDETSFEPNPDESLANKTETKDIIIEDKLRDEVVQSDDDPENTKQGNKVLEGKEGGENEEEEGEEPENGEVVLSNRHDQEQGRKEGEETEEEIKPQTKNVVVVESSKRHGKKDTPAYNDVIEETASKLLEKRKNKVKALVGAFETVIDYESSSK